MKTLSRLSCAVIPMLVACSTPPVATRDAAATDAGRDGANPPVDAAMDAQPDSGDPCATDPNCGRDAAPEAAVDAGADATMQCPMGLSACGGMCVDTITDRANCGACGVACAANQTCTMGACIERCPLGQTRCGALCVDTSVDNSNCGSCGRACAARETCSMSNCVADCPMGQSACGGACVDTTTSDSHCGMCGNACAASERCVTGMCRSRCAAGEAFCGGVCQNTQTSNAHCGACNNACPAGQSCSMGVCSLTCMAPTMRCGGVCIDTTSSASNCGSCGAACPPAANGTPVCAGSRCGLTCASGFGNCDGSNANGCEVDTRSSLAHCGACGRTCAAGANQSATCSLGACLLRCAAGFGDCDGNAANGCETDVNFSVTHCGVCGRSCPAPINGLASCSSGVCGTICNRGDLLCGAAPGVCANPLSDPNNCGACGNRCAAGQSCVAGACRAVCPAGQTACGPSMTCVDLNSNAANCGACSRACAAGESCASGACLAPFRVTSFGTTCNTVNTEQLHGDQRGSLAVGATRLFVNADQGMASFDPLTVATAPNVVGTSLDGAVHDLFTGQLFVLGDAQGPIQWLTGMRSVDRLWRAYQGVWDRSSPVMLSRSIAIDTSGSSIGVYNGGGRAIVHTTNVYDINLSTGLVTDRGAMAQPTRVFPESFRTTGIVEQSGSSIYLTNIQSSTAIARTLVPSGVTTTVAMFTNLGDAAHFTVYSAGASSRWLMRFEGSSQFGVVPEGLVSCPVTVTQNTTTGDLTVGGYTVAGCTVVDTNAIAGDDRGPIAVGYGEAYVVGDGGTIRFASAATPVLTSAFAVGSRGDHVVYNLANGALFGLYTDSLPLHSNIGIVSVNRLVPLSEGNLLPAGAGITLSQPISINTSDSSANMVFNGWDRLVIFTGGRLWNVNLSNGDVRDFGALVSPTHWTNEQWASVGIVESTGSATDLVYVESGTRIARLRVGTGAISTAGAFTMLGDMGTIGFSPARNRWYWQAEYTNQFAAMPSAEWVGTCNATFAR